MGFWDNILARGFDGRVEIAYGHHRWEALKRVMDLTDWIDIPIKDLDDATMLKVMANENMESWALGPKVIDETVRVTKKFLEEHPEEIHLTSGRRPDQGIGALTISKFLGWNETRVHYSLERLNLIDEGILDKEAVESMPSDNAARDLVDGDYKRICMSMGMERKVEGCHIDGVISWSAAVRLFPAAASPFSARSSPPSAPTGTLRRSSPPGDRGKFPRRQ
jgi:hypothetical protein